MPVSQATRFQKLLTFLLERYQFRELKALLIAEGVEAATSKAKLFEKYAELNGSAAVRSNEVLTDLCSDLVVAGTKDVFIFHLEEDDVATICASLALVGATTNEYSQSYPLPLSETELKLRSTDHEFVRKIEYASGDISLGRSAKPLVTPTGAGCERRGRCGAWTRSRLALTRCPRRPARKSSSTR